MFHHVSPTQQVRENYAGATGYTKELTLRSIVVHAALFALAFSLIIPVGAVLWRWLQDILHPLEALRVLFEPLVLLAFVFFLVFSSVFYIGVTLLVWLVSNSTWQAAQASAEVLDQQGAVTQAVIIDRWTATFANAHDQWTSHYLAYTYGGYAVRQQVSSKTYRASSVGMTVRVRYLPSNPLVARLEDAH